MLGAVANRRRNCFLGLISLIFHYFYFFSPCRCSVTAPVTAQTHLWRQEAALLPRGRPRPSRVAGSRLQAPALPRGLLRLPGHPRVCAPLPGSARGPLCCCLRKGTERPGGQDATEDKLQGHKGGRVGMTSSIKVVRDLQDCSNLMTGPRQLSKLR